MARKEDYEVFCKKFVPEMDGENGLKRYDNVEHYYGEAMEKAGDGNRHLWSVLEGDSGKWYIVPGLHIINREFYIITENPWEEGQRDYLYV